MTSERECYVYIVLPGETDFVTAGRFQVSVERDGTQTGRFVYGRHYLDRNDAVELDPIGLRLSNAVHETARLRGFFGAIRDAMPDYWGRRVIEKHTGHLQLEEMDYLLEAPDDRAGALGFGLNVEPPAPRREFNQTLDLARLQAAADRILDDEPTAPDTDAVRAQELMLIGTSIGGARPKAVVQDGGDLWIAKFSRNDDRWNQSRVEHGMLELARACGLHAADSRMVTVGGRDVLLVRRFDRNHTDNGFRRHRMVSAMTLLDADESIVSRDAWSYLRLADEIRRTSVEPEHDLRELYGRMVFNAAVSNEDDHPRNHAMIARTQGWRLSPAFDLTPTPRLSLDRRDLALTCGKYGRQATRLNLLSDAGRFLLSKDEATAVVERIVHTVLESWTRTMRRVGASDADCEAIRGAFLYPGFEYDSEIQS